MHIFTFLFIALSVFIPFRTEGFDILNEMTLEEKIGQLFIVHFHGEIANEDARTLIQDVKVGGFIYYNWCNGLTSPEQVQTLSFGLQKLAEKNRIPIPLFIAIDQEGGVVSRLNNGFTSFPGNKALGATDDPTLAKEAALCIGLELQAVGINMNFAPVVDVNINPRNPIIGVRSFGENPETVIAFGAEALNGYKKANIITSLKHFPGHGDVEIDSHEDLPIIHKSMIELEKVELLPFAKLASSAEMMMTAHLLIPALDQENCSTLSEKTLGYLRNAIGFKGVIISDSLVMEGVLKKYHTVDETAIEALNAGCDLLLFGGKALTKQHSNLELTLNDIQRIQKSILNAVKSGRISELRINEALEKILKLKERYIDKVDFDNQPNLNELVNTPTHRALASKIAAQALKICTISPGVINALQQKNIAVFSPQALCENLSQTTIGKVGKTVDLNLFSDVSPGEEEMSAAKRSAEKADVLLIFSYNGWKNHAQAEYIHSLIASAKPVILVTTRDPLDDALFPDAALIFNTFSPTIPSLQAVCDQLMKNEF